MKKAAVFFLLVAMIATMIIPAGISAKDGELLYQVDFLKDTFETIARESGIDYKFDQKFDLSNSTSDMLVPVKKAGVSDAIWDAPMSYITRTGYYVTDDTKYTVYFEVGDVHHGRWFGIPFIYEFNNGSTIMIGGAMADNGEFDDAETGTKFSQIVIAYDRPDTAHNVGEGYNEHGWLFYHPAITTDALIVPDNCDPDETVNEAQFTTIKIEIDGRRVTPYYLDAAGTFVKMSDTFEYDTEIGSEIVLGTYSREGMRHNIVRNVKLLQGTGLNMGNIISAPKTTDPKPPKPEPAATTAEQTTANQETEASPSDSDEASGSETAAPVASDTVPQTQEQTQPQNVEGGKKGCGSFAAAPAFIAAAALVFFRKKSKTV